MHGRLLHLAAGARQDAHQIVGAACRASEVHVHLHDRQPPGGHRLQGLLTRQQVRFTRAVDSLPAGDGAT